MVKGISHFITGVAWASCWPWTMEAAVQGQAGFLLLGAFFGLLPDTLDFKMGRYACRYDEIITPDPRGLDVDELARRVARAVSRAAETGRESRLKFNALQVTHDLWRRFFIRFDEVSSVVEVEVGPLVDTGQLPAEDGGEGRFKLGRCPCGTSLSSPYGKEVVVDIFDGASFSFVPGEAGRVVVQFLPWHRGWTHSLVVALGWAVVCALFAGWQGAVVVGGAYVLHILQDQLGYMGSSLLAPFSRRRFSGAGWMHSGDGWPNGLTVWLMLHLILWNCARSSEVEYGLGLALIAALVPLCVVWIWRVSRRFVGSAVFR